MYIRIMPHWLSWFWPSLFVLFYVSSLRVWALSRCFDKLDQTWKMTYCNGAIRQRPSVTVPPFNAHINSPVSSNSRRSNYLDISSPSLIYSSALDKFTIIPLDKNSHPSSHNQRFVSMGNFHEEDVVLDVSSSLTCTITRSLGDIKRTQRDKNGQCASWI